VDRADLFPSVSCSRSTERRSEEGPREATPRRSSIDCERQSENRYQTASAAALDIAAAAAEASGSAAAVPFASSFIRAALIVALALGLAGGYRWYEE
jgi:hypothetical protein